MAIKLFFSYAHEDEPLLDDLKSQLRPLQRQGLIDIWHDRDISAGSEWAQAIDQHLKEAQIILLLVSPDFINSDYCYSIEMRQAIQRHEQGKARVIPIILRYVHWQETPLGKLQALPKDAKPLRSWPDQDEAFFNVVGGIRKAVEELIEKTNNNAETSQQTTEQITIDTRTIAKEAKIDEIEAPLQHRHYEDWGEALHPSVFYGREKELAELERWILDDGCRMVAVLGIGGMGKTVLAAKLAERIQDKFEYIFWRSLQNAPQFESILKSCIQLLSNQQQIDMTDDIDRQILALFQCLQDHHCLLVLDNIETILRPGTSTGLYREGYEAYGRFMQRLAEGKHQSCLLLTSREKPKEVAYAEGKTSPVRSLQLSGLGLSEGQEILKDKDLYGTDETWTTLIQLYVGNPLALKLVSEPIRELFDGDVAGFLKRGEVVVGDVFNLLEQQFQRLPEIERELMYWLAIEREAISLDDLKEELVHVVSEKELLEALKSLRRRSLIEKSDAQHFNLQPLILEYVTNQFIEQMLEEIAIDTIGLFDSHVLIKAQAKEYVRESQERLILQPFVERLLSNLGNEGIDVKLKRILALLHEKQSQKPSYAAGNTLNILIQLQADLQSYDFSHLTVWQAYLQNVALTDVNFAYANLAKSVFTETFGCALSVAFSPDGNLLAAGTNKGKIQIWQSNTYRPLFSWQGHTDWVWSVAFNSAGSMIASGSSDRTIRLWDVKTGNCFAVLKGHNSWVRSVTFNQDGDMLASSSEDETIRLWDVKTGSCMRTLSGHSHKVWSVAFSPDKSLLASGSSDQTVRLWDVSSGQCLKILEGHSHWILSVAFSPDGKILASGSSDQTVRLWDVSSGQCLKILEGHTDRIGSIAFSQNGPTLASSGNDQTIRLWEVSTGYCLRTLQGHGSWVRSIAFRSNDQFLASASDDQTVRLWNTSNGYCLHILQGHANLVRSVAFSPDGLFLANGNDDQKVRLWQVSTGNCHYILHGHTYRIWSVAFSPDGSLLASGGHDQTIRLWDVKTGHCMKTLHTHRVYSITFNLDGSALASSGDDQSIRLWELSTGSCLMVFTGHSHAIRSISLNSDGSTLASGSDDQTIRLWDVSTGLCLRVLEGHTDRVWSVAFSPDGSLLASGSEDRTVRLWEVSTGNCLMSLQDQADRVYSVAFSPDGQILASGNNDRTIRLWDVDTGSCLKILKGHDDRVRSIAFSSVGSLLVSGSEDGTMKLWDVQTGNCLRTLRSDRPYERMNITGVKGLTESQKASLYALGAVENE